MKKTPALWAKTLGASLATCALAFSLCACNSGNSQTDPEPTPEPESEPATITFTDLTGYEMTLEQSPTNMLMNWPGGLAVMLMFDQGDNMAAYMSTVTKAGYSWMQRVAPAIKTKPVADDLTAEAALDLGADLVIVKSEKEAEPYRNAGLNCIAMQQNNMDQLREVVTTYGIIFGMEEHAQAYLTYLDDTLAFIADRLKDIPEDEYLVVYSINAGRGKTPTVTDGGNTTSTTYCALAGGVNATLSLDISGYGAEISVEQLMELNPDVIVVNGNSSQTVYADLLADPTLSQMPAVVAGETYIVPMGVHTWSGSGPECILYIQWLAKTLYPELFADVDMHEMVQDFYSTFYFTDFTDEEIDAMLSGYPSLDAYRSATGTASNAA